MKVPLNFISCSNFVKIIGSLAILAFKIQAEFSTIYTALSPPNVYPNSEYKIQIFLEPLFEETVINFTAQLQCGIFTYESRSKVAIESGKLGEVVIATQNIDEPYCTLTLACVEDGHAETRTSNVITGIDSFFFIQTDRPIYKPQDKIQLRVLLLDRRSKPKSDAFHVRIFDSQKNLIRRWDNVSAQVIFRSSVELSYEPNLGEWKIEAFSRSTAQKRIVTFKVAKYVLPKFDVEIDLPDYEIATIRQIKVPVRAKYTYGGGVKGTCTVAVSLYYKICSRVTKKDLANVTFPIDGSGAVEIPLENYIGPNTKNGAELQFRVVVTESATGKSAKSEKNVRVYKYPYHIRPVEKLSFYRPGLPFLIAFEIIDHANRIVEARGENVTVTHNFDVGGVQTYTQPILKGRIELNLTASETIDLLKIDVTYKNLTYHYLVPEKLHSRYPIRNQLLIHTDSSTFSLSQSKLTIHVTASENLTSVNCIVVSRDEILSSELFTIDDLSSFDINVTIPTRIHSEARIFIFTFIGDDYIGDYLNLRVATSENLLEISTTNSTYLPGEDVTLSITSTKKSVVAIRGIDESINLLSGSNDITLSSLHRKIDSNKLQDKNLVGYFELNESGMLIHSNGDQKRAGWLNRLVSEPFDEICSKTTSLESGDSTTAVSEANPPKFNLRSVFPETWLWEELTLNDSASVVIKRKVPDTLTSWVISGFSVSPELGIGFLDTPRKITTYKDFFVTLDLPYSVIQREQVRIKLLVHNYLEGKYVTLRIKNDNNEWSFLNQTDATNFVTNVWASGSTVTPVTIDLIPLKFGEVMLEIKADAGNAVDALLTALRVIPSGEKTTISQKKILRGIGLDEKTKLQFTHKLPYDTKPGSDTVKITLISDIMSVAGENLEKLIELPVGCGEQNMVNFVADVVILNYLSAAGRLTKTIQDKATRFLELGYQRELTFRHDDGSFSAFGKKDPTGSTWLTAYVIRYFLAAEKYITVDPQVIQEGLQYLKSHQLDTGRFEDLGRLIDSNIKGSASSSGVALTAFCALTFIEADKKKGMAVYPVFEKARSFFRSYFSSSQLNDMYAVSLVTYVEHAWHALHPNQSTMKDEYFDILAKSAVNFEFDGNDLRYWRDENGERGHLPETKPVNIEMTGYALLVYLKRNDLDGAMPIVKWLLQNQNSEGGFLSTQDTVVALVALGEYFEKRGLGVVNMDMVIQEEYKGEDTARTRKRVNKEHRKIFINNTNAGVLQEFHFDKANELYEIVAFGIGNVYVTVSWSYYSNSQSNPRQSDFEIQINPIEKESKSQGLNICTSFNGQDQSNMAIVEVNLPSGFTIDTSDLERSLGRVPNFKKHEVTNKHTKLDVYFDFISRAQTCVQVAVVRTFHVAKLAFTYVRVYDYYVPSRKSILFYDPAKITPSDDS